MSTIDEKYIEEAKDNRRGGKISEKLWLGAVAAACVAVFVGGLFTGSYLFGNTSVNPSLNDYVIENGVLLAYTGEDTELTIPDEVTEITADSFRSSANCVSISEIHLNSAVSKIDETAFAELKSLKALTVSDENQNFNFHDGVIGAADGSVYFGTAELWKDELFFLEKIMEMEKNIEEYKDITFISAGNIIIELKRENFDLDSRNMINEVPYYFFNNFSVKSIRAYGYKKVFDFPEYLGLSDIRINAFQTDEAFVFAIQKYRFRLDWYEDIGEIKPIVGDTYIFTENGIYEDICSVRRDDGERRWFDMDDPDWHTHIIYHKREDGKLGYVRRPEKYFPDYNNRYLKEEIGLAYCVSRDEYCKDEGFVSFDNGRMTYVPERVYTVSELCDMEEWYYGERGYKERGESLLADLYFREEYDEALANGTIYEENGFLILSDFYVVGATLDEYLEYNSRRYERAEMPKNASIELEPIHSKL